MNPNWIWLLSTGGASNSVDLSLHTMSNGPLDEFLYLNLTIRSTGMVVDAKATALVYTGANTSSSQAANSLHSDDSVSVTYYSGSGNLNFG